MGILAFLTGLMIIADEKDTKKKIDSNKTESAIRCQEWHKNFEELEKLRNKRY